MNVKQLSKWAAALAFSVAGSQAFADCTNSMPGQAGGDALTQVTCAEAASGLQVYIGGASAPDGTFVVGTGLTPADGGIFVEGSIRRFEGSASGTDSSVTCGRITSATVTALSTDGVGSNPTLTGDVSVVCIHKSAHGSGTGNGPLVASTPVNFLDISMLATDCPASTETLIQPNSTSAIEVHTGCDAATTIAQNAGASDVEPALFELDPSTLSTGSIFALPWQIQVSTPFYLALQAAQFPASDRCNPTNAMYDASGDGTVLIGDGTSSTPVGTTSMAASLSAGVSVDPACIPTLTENQVRSIMVAGSMVFAEEMVDGSGTSLGSAAAAISPFSTAIATHGQASAISDPTITDEADLAAREDEFDDGTLTTTQATNTSPFGSPIWLCRRRVGSGTQASFEATWLRERCFNPASGGVTMRPQGHPESNDLPGGSGDGRQIAPSLIGTTDINGTTFGGEGSSDVVECLERASNAGIFAIGINSNERTYDEENEDRNNWRTVKVDGVLPGAIETTTGKWDKFSEIVCNTRPGEDSSILEAEVARLVCSSLGSVSTGLIDSANHEWGDGGPMELSSTGTNFIPQATFAGGLTAVEYRAAPINHYTKQLSGGTNNCAVPVKNASPGFGVASGMLIVTPVD